MSPQIEDRVRLRIDAQLELPQKKAHWGIIEAMAVFGDRQQRLGVREPAQTRDRGLVRPWNAAELRPGRRIDRNRRRRRTETFDRDQLMRIPYRRNRATVRAYRDQLRRQI